MKKMLLIFGMMSMLFASATVMAEAKTCDVLFENLNLCVDINWDHGPILRQENRLTLLLEDALTEVDEVKVVLWMPHHGHGSRPTQVSDLGMTSEGQLLEVSKIFFVMPGLWEVKISITKDGQLQEKVLEYVL